MTKYVISGYIGFDNFGDEAIAKVLTSHLKKLDAEKITVLSSNPHKTARLYNVYSANYLNFFKPILESDILIVKMNILKNKRKIDERFKENKII